MGYIYQKHKHVFSILTIIVMNFGMIFRFYDIYNLNEKEYAYKDMLINAGVVTIIMPLYMYFTQVI